MSTVVAEQSVNVPVWVVDLESFRRWTDSEDFPEKGRISYLNGGVWIDMSMEQLFSHNQVKTEYTSVLASLAKAERRGRYFSDGVYLSNVTADISNQPDGTFVSFKSLRVKRVRLVEGAEEGYVELEGTPDMLLEIISDSSVRKDTQWLKELYWQAGVTEYWLVDVRGGRTQFDILRHVPKGYAPVRKQGGWQKSEVFAKSFKLTVEQGEDGHPEYTLSFR